MVAERILDPMIAAEDPDTLRLGVYNTAARRIAAREGWHTRRYGPTPWQRFLALYNRVADGPARLYCCELVERHALPVYQAAFPDDPRPAAILWTARRYARGEASAGELPAMRRVAIALADPLTPRGYAITTPEAMAAQALWWCVDGVTSRMLWSVCTWIDRLCPALGGDAFYREIVAVLEAMPRKEGRGARAI